MTKATIKFSEDSPLIYLHGDGFVLNEEDKPSKLLVQLLYFVQEFVKVRSYYDAEYMTARCIQYLANVRDNDILTYGTMRVTGIGVYNSDAEIDTNYKIIITPDKLWATDRDGLIIQNTELSI